MLFTARAKPTTAPTAPTPQNDSSSSSSSTNNNNNNTEQQQQQQTSSSSSSSTTTISPTSPISSSQRGAHARSVSFDITALSQQDAQKKGREAEHFLINFFLKKENLKASLLLEHLSRYNDHTNGFKGCWQFLCNKLYELELSDVEFYLPQLLNIYVRRVIEKKSPLERYFLEKSMESMHFAIRCCWLLDAQIQQLQMLQQMSSNAPLPAVPTSITNPQLIETNNSNNSNSNNNNNNNNNNNGNNNSSLTSSLSASNLSLLKSTNMNNDQSIYTEDAPLTTLEKCIYLRSMVEQVCVNQLIPSWYIPRGVDQCSSSSSNNGGGGGGGGESYLREDLINSNSQMANFVKSNVFSKQRRLNYFNDEMDFWNFLTDLSTRLKAYPTGPIRKQRMKLELEQLNKCIPSGCYVPQCTSNDAHCRIVRIVASECIVFSTKERVPYLIVAEVMEGPFTVSQPMLAHMMHGEFYEERVYNQQVYCSVTMHSPRMKTPNRTNSWPSSSSSSTASILSGGGSGGGGGRINNLEEIDFESYERSIDGVSGGSTTSSGSGHHHQHHQHHNSQSVRSSTVRKVMSSSHGIIDSSIDIPVMGLERRSSADPRIESDSGILSDHRKRVEKDLGGDEDGDFVLVDRDKMMEADREALLRTVFGESWEEKKQRLQRTSPFGMAPGWDIKGFIVKSNDDIRQEQFAMQLIKMFQKIFLEEKLPVYLRTYAITVTNADSGIIEAVTDTASIDGLKKKFPNFTTLKDYYVKVYGSPESKRFRRAQQNFIESMAGYCVVCYLLQIKDRHNGNILIDREGNIVHIDFGFILGNSPGGVGFENAPFKLTAEMMDVMGGPDGEMFNNYFRPLVFMCFQAAAKHKEKVLSLIRMMSGINFACFMGDATAATTIRELDKRFNSQLDDMKFAQWVRSLVDESMDNWRTRQYDSFQRLTNGIL